MAIPNPKSGLLCPLGIIKQIQIALCGLGGKQSHGFYYYYIINSRTALGPVVDGGLGLKDCLSETRKLAPRPDDSLCFSLWTSLALNVLTSSLGRAQASSCLSSPKIPTASWSPQADPAL